jgi:hypothetical protein
MTADGRRTRRWLLTAAAAGFALRAAFGLLYWVDKPLTHDEREYLGLARSLSDGRGFAHDESIDVGTGQRFGRAPGYPVFLAAVGAGRVTLPAGQAGDVPARVKLAQALVGALTVYLIGVVAWGAAGPRAAAMAAWLAAIYPPLVWIPAYALSEALYSAVALATALVVQRAFDAGPHAHPGRLAAGAGTLVAASILVRPAMLFFLPLAAGWFVLRGHLKQAVVMTAAVVAVLTPWTVRNAIVYDRFILVASEGGVTFWTGNHPLAIGEGDLAANPRLKEAELAFRRAHPDLTPEELEPLYYRDALAAIADDPLWWIGLLARKAFYTVVPAGPSYTLHSTRYWAASVFSYALLLPFALVGLRRLWADDRRPTAVLLLGASAVLTGLVFFPQERFRIPVIDPVLIIAAAALAARPHADARGPARGAPA